MSGIELLWYAMFVAVGMLQLLLGSGKWPVDPAKRMDMQKGDRWGFSPLWLKVMGGFLVLYGLAQIGWRLYKG